MSEPNSRLGGGDAMFDVRSTADQLQNSAHLQSVDHHLNVLRNKLQRRHLRLSQCVASLVLHRSQTHNGWQYCADARTFHEESLQALHEELAKGSSDGPASMTAIDDLRGQATEDLEVLLARSRDTKAQEERRIALEGKFGSLQQSFMMAVDEFMNQLNGLAPEDKVGDEYDQSTSADLSVLGEQPCSETHPLLERYYDGAGELQLLGEQLAELDFAYQEAVAESELLQDQGMMPELSDAIRQKEYLRQRGELEVALDAAILESDELKRLCVVEGLLPLQEPMMHSTNIIVADEELQSSARGELEMGLQSVQGAEKLLVSPEHASAAIMSQTDRLTESSAPVRRSRPSMVQSMFKVAAWIDSTELHPTPGFPQLSDDEVRARSSKLRWLLDKDSAISYSGARVHPRPYVSMPELRSRQHCDISSCRT